MTEKVEKTEAEWREELTPEQYDVLREQGHRARLHRRATGTPRTTASTAAPAAAPSCSAPTRSSTPAPAGRASSSRWPPSAVETRDGQQPRSCAAPRSSARAAAATSGHVFDDGPRPDRPALLHQLLLARPRAAGRVDRLATQCRSTAGAPASTQRLRAARPSRRRAARSRSARSASGRRRRRCRSACARASGFAVGRAGSGHPRRRAW